MRNTLYEIVASESRRGNMSNRYAALLRGINVGRAKRVDMADLRRLVGALGYTGPRTLLNSGNVVFCAPEVDPANAAARIEAALATDLGVSARVVVVTAGEIAAVVGDNPFDPVDDPARLLVAFLAQTAHASRLRPMLDRDWAPEALAVKGRVAYLWCPQGVAASALSVALSQALGEAVTTRNWSTVLKLQALMRD